MLNLLYVAVFGYGYNLGETAYHIVAIGNWLGDFVENLFLFEINPYNSIIGICLLYQIIYFIINSSSHQDIKTLNKPSKKNDIPKIIFIITLFFWLGSLIYIIYSMVFGIEEVDFCFFNCSSEIVYGIEALGSVMFTFAMLTVIPIIPVITIYDIAYIIIRKKKGLNLIKR